MAKKNEALSYLQMPLPQGQTSFKTTKVNWSGLNKRQVIDTGVLSAESNISTNEYPYLTPSPVWKPYDLDGVSLNYDSPIGIYAFDDFIIVVYILTGNIMIDYIKGDERYTSLLNDNNDYSVRSIVKFNVCNVTTDVWTQKLLIFPDKKSINFNITATGFTVSNLDVAIPEIKFATVHLSRLFGVNDNNIYASGFNDYANWDMDTPTEYSAEHAWYSPAQANPNANGAFTGIVAYGGHVVAFKRDYTHELYNTKNPFRIQDIFNEGCVDQRSIQEVDGKLFFVSADDVKVYTGSNPTKVGNPLNIDKFVNARSGTDGRRYYLSCMDGKGDWRMFTYDTQCNQWSEQNFQYEIVGFAHNHNGMYALGIENDDTDAVWHIYILSTSNYNDQAWSCETDLFTNKSVDIKTVKKIQILCDLDADSSVTVSISYDNSATFATLQTYTSATKTTLPIRIVPRQSSGYGFKLKFNGTGYVKLYQFEIIVDNGGELYV